MKYLPKFFTTKYLSIYLIVIGIVLRIRQYVINRSLWIDEARLALNIVNRSFSELTLPLDYNQGAPIGFLFIQKIAVQFLGNNEYILRLFPLITGIASLFLFYRVVESYPNEIKLTALGLSCFSESLIYYTSEVKQYSSDVIVFLFILVGMYDCLKPSANIKSFTRLGLIGMISLWISHPATFAIFGVSVCLALEYYIKKDWQKFRWLLVLGLIWLLNFTIIYFVSLQFLIANDYLVNYWQENYMPIPPWNNLKWFISTYSAVLEDPVGLPVIISAILVGFGFISLVFSQWQLVLFLGVTFLIALLASGFEKYPVSDRLVLFAVPAFYLLIAEGVYRFRLLLLKINRRISLIITCVLTIALLFIPISHAIRNFMRPSVREHIKPVMSYLVKHREREDQIYVYYGAIPAFRYYAPFYDIEEQEFVEGIENRTDPTSYIKDVDRLRLHKRVWFVFSHNCSWCIVDEETYYLTYLDSIGIRVNQFSSQDTSVYLYKLVKTKSDTLR
jgi:hypothetical protein